MLAGTKLPYCLHFMLRSFMFHAVSLHHYMFSSSDIRLPKINGRTQVVNFWKYNYTESGSEIAFSITFQSGGYALSNFSKQFLLLTLTIFKVLYVTESNNVFVGFHI